MNLALLAATLAACGGGSADGDAGAQRVQSASVGTAAALTVPAASTTSTEAPRSAAPETAAGTAPVAAALLFNFELPTSRMTSAGVYDTGGTLLRTLWRGERLAAGRHARSWDLRRDDGQAVPAGAAEVRLIHHDVQYRWDGVVGNSSAQAGRMPHRSFLPPMSLAAHGGQLHIGLGYNEAQSALHGLRLDAPQRPAPAVSHADPFIGFGLVASDGSHLYAANTGGLHKGGFVVAFSVASGRQVAFEQGRALCLVRLPDGNCYPSQSYAGVTAERPVGEPLPTGLAVQRQGSLLAVAYGAENRVQVFDKRSGQSLSQWSVPLAAHSANHLAMAVNGDLWVLGDDTALRYTDIDTQPRVVQTIVGLRNALALAADPADSDGLWIAEGGDRQQVRRVGRGGTTGLVIGQAGGLRTDAAAAPDRLCFAAEGGREHTALTVDGTGALWVVDTCNNRLQRFAASGQPIDTVAWLPASYTTAVDPNHPQRVFSNFLEFEVNTDRALDAPGGWRLVRNWLPSLPAALRDADSANSRFGGLRLVVTLSNGRTYAQMSVAGQTVVVELTAAGRVREVMRLTVPSNALSAPVIQPNGDLHYARDEEGRQVVYRQRLEGFSVSGDPRWSSLPLVLAAVPMGGQTPHHRSGTFSGLTGPRWPVTESGLVVYFNPGVDVADGFHLGAAAAGQSTWAWQASPSGPLDGRGSFQTRSSDARIEYGGNVAMVSGRSVLYGYHGEFYGDAGNGRVGQANQFMHFLDNGLFVGQFGLPSTRSGAVPEPGLSGNAFSPWLVKAAGRTYLYHNDESSWGGVHRWELVGVDGIAELRASGEPGATLTLR